MARGDNTDGMTEAMVRSVLPPSLPSSSAARERRSGARALASSMGGGAGGRGGVGGALTPHAHAHLEAKVASAKHFFAEPVSAASSRKLPGSISPAESASGRGGVDGDSAATAAAASESGTVKGTMTATATDAQAAATAGLSGSVRPPKVPAKSSSRTHELSEMRLHEDLHKSRGAHGIFARVALHERQETQQQQRSRAARRSQRVGQVVGGSGVGVSAPPPLLPKDRYTNRTSAPQHAPSRESTGSAGGAPPGSSALDALKAANARIRERRAAERETAAALASNAATPRPSSAPKFDDEARGAPTDTTFASLKLSQQPPHSPARRRRYFDHQKRQLRARGESDSAVAAADDKLKREVGEGEGGPTSAAPVMVSDATETRGTANEGGDAAGEEVGVVASVALGGSSADDEAVLKADLDLNRGEGNRIDGPKASGASESPAKATDEGQQGRRRYGTGMGTSVRRYQRRCSNERRLGVAKDDSSDADVAAGSAPNPTQRGRHGPRPRKQRERPPPGGAGHLISVDVDDENTASSDSLSVYGMHSSDSDVPADGDEVAAR